MPELVNPLAAFREGYNTLEGMAQDRTRRQAGNALAGGDYQGAQAALYGRGMLQEGQGVGQMQQGMEDRQAGQQAAQAEAEKKAAADRAQRGIAILTRMKDLPPDQIATDYQSTLRPYLAEVLPPEMLARIDAAPKTPENVNLLLTAMGAEAEKLQLFNTSGGIVGVQGGQSRMIYEAPPKPPEQIEGPDGIYERGPDGKWMKVANFGAAPRTFAPQRPRAAGGGGGSRGHGFSDVPPGAVVE